MLGPRSNTACPRPVANGRRCPTPRGSASSSGSFAAALEEGDVDAVVALLTEDAWVTMPPQPYEYQGAEAIGAVPA